MADFITKTQFKANEERINGNLNVTFAKIEAKLSKAIKNRSQFESSVFISHSHENSDLVEYLVALLNRLKVDVYVDWMDDELSYPPSSSTALKIKNMIVANKKFLLLATNEGIESKWCNWELGIGDAHKYIDNIALLPVADNSGKWIGNEYLRLYPYIDKKYKNLEWDNEYVVIYPNGINIDFMEWLKNK